MQLEDILSQGEEKCIQKPCVQQQQCCPGSVCVDLHSQHSQSPLSLSSSMNNKQRPGKFMLFVVFIHTNWNQIILSIPNRLICVV